MKNTIKTALPGLKSNRVEHTALRPARMNRFRGSLLGCAVGDALGMAVEGMDRALILKKHGPRIENFLPKPNRRLEAGQWTDDTLLTISTVDSILRAKAIVPSNIAYQLGRSFQTENFRGFGTSTKTALKRVQKGGNWREVGVDGEFAAGNGAAMRIAPVALFSYSNLQQLKRNCEMVASITHKNQEAINGGLVVAYVVASIINGKFRPDNVLSEASSFIGPSKVAERLILTKEILDDKSTDVEKALSLLGTTGSVFDTIGSSLYLFLRFLSSFEESLVNSVSFGGDTDTIAAIVGSMSGALHGEAAIPARWLNGVEGGKQIISKADQLYNLVHGI